MADHRIRTITLLLLGVVFTCSLGVAFIPTFLEDVRGYQPASIVPVILFAYLLRGGFFSAWAMLNASLGVNAPARHRARGFAIVEMAGGLAASFGPIVGGLLYARSNTLSFEVAIVLGVCLIPVLLWVNRSARLWPHPDPEPAAHLEDEPVIGEAPEIAPELVPDPSLDLQPLVIRPSTTTPAE
jgi:MFS family permease